MKTGTAMSGANGLELLKARIARTNGAWGSVFKITQWNYLAFSAATALSTTGIFAKFLEQAQIPALAVVCAFTVMVSCASAVLAYLFLNYAYDLHWHEKRAERAWLKGKDGREFVKEMQAEPVSPYAKKAETVELTRNGIVDLVTNIYFLINVAPAVVALGTFFLILWRLKG